MDLIIIFEDNYEISKEQMKDIGGMTSHNSRKAFFLIVNLHFFMLTLWKLILKDSVIFIN